MDAVQDGAWPGWLDGPLTLAQPVHGRVDLIGANRGELEIGLQGGVAPPLRRGQLRTRMHHPGQDHRVGDVAFFTRRPQQLAQTQRLGHDRDRSQVSVGQRTSQIEPRASDHQGLAAESGLDGLNDLFGEVREIGQGLVAHLGPLAHRTTKQVRLIGALIAVFANVVATGCGHMHRTATPGHKGILPDPPPRVNVFSGYINTPSSDPRPCSRILLLSRSDVTSA